MNDDTAAAKESHIDNRHLFRQLLVQRLYKEDYIQTNKLKKDKEVVADEPDFLEDLELEHLSGKLNRKLRRHLQDADDIIEGIRSSQNEIDTWIQELAPEWPLDKINPVDLEIMRLAIYEGFIGKLIPARVAIDEAIELARDFGTESDVKFVSGVLGNLYNKDEFKESKEEDEDSKI
ncbi:MAG: transcription antitermination factor NusB [Candidatus Dojkabacteria bacterium]